MPLILDCRNGFRHDHIMSPDLVQIMTIIAVLYLFTIHALAQSVQPSNSSTDIGSYVSSPRFWVNATGLPTLRIAPLGWYAQISQSNFLSVQLTGRLVLITPPNANTFLTDAFDYLSCDPEDYPGNIDASATFARLVQSNQNNGIILYSRTSDHCNVSTLQGISLANGVFTTTSAIDAGHAVTALQAKGDNGISVTVNPDPSSYRNGGNGPPNMNTPGGTTAIAMIVLYTITGLITALFVVIIVTGAVRAHRHPERYGPHPMSGGPRQSRAKGIGRAMLETLPLVRFGDRAQQPKPFDPERDIEMNTGQVAGRSSTTITEDASIAVPVATMHTSASNTDVTNADGTDDSGNLGCSICTEDFTQGEEVRVLPCNHKFHPDCVDPWLLNVSGTCPLCRIDLRPKNEQESETEAESAALAMGDAAALHAAQASGRRDTAAYASLRGALGDNRENRIAALRRFRQQVRRERGLSMNPSMTDNQQRPIRDPSPEQDQEREREREREDRRTLAVRLRDRFRIRTRHADDSDLGSNTALQGISPRHEGEVGGVRPA